MKKVIFLLLVVIMLAVGICCFTFTSCDSTEDESLTSIGVINDTLDCSEALYADKITHIVYVYTYNDVYAGKVRTLCPYYSPNGYLYRYENGQLIEVIPGQTATVDTPEIEIKD